MDALFALDRALFLFINHLPHTSVTDIIAMTISGVSQWGLIWFVISLYLFFREEKRDHWFFLPLVLSIITTWVLSEMSLKFWFGRLRPTSDMGAVIVQSAQNYSFPSTHATFAWALAVVLANIEPTWKAWFYAIAIAISFTRIYLGVHYPLDVVAGGVLGYGIGVLSIRIVSWLKR